MSGNCDTGTPPARNRIAAMRPLSARAEIDAPREPIFELLCDLSLRPAFTDHFQTQYRLGRVDAVGPGASARFQLRESGLWLDTVIERVEGPHLVREAGHGGRDNRVPNFTAWELAEGARSLSSEVTVTFWTEPSNPFDKLSERRRSRHPHRRDWSRALARLKKLVEGDEPVESVTIAGMDRVPEGVR